MIATAASLTLASGSASAKVIGHSFSTTISGSGASALSHPEGIAVDKVTGDVYVSDPAKARVEKFDTEGHFLLMFGKEVNSGTGDPNVCTNTGAPTDVCKAGTPTTSADGFTLPNWVAVDNSNGPSRGDVYVGDEEYPASVQKFTPDGTLITSWGEGGQLHRYNNGAYEFEVLGGIALDTHGKLYVVTYFGEVARFSGSGTYEEYSFDEFPRHGEEYSPGLAINSTENLFYVGYFNETVRKYKPFPQFQYLGETTPFGTSVRGLAVDEFNDDSLYAVLEGTHVSAYKSSCEPGNCVATETFGTGHLTGAGEVAVDPVSHRVFVTEPAAGRIAVFEPTIQADAKPKPTSDITPVSLTLNGVADPAGGPEVTGCSFEYGLSAGNYTLGPPISCEAEAPAALPYTTATPVHAELSGLSLHTIYHYRLAVTNANGTNVSADQIAETAPERPLVKGTSSSGVEPTHAILEAEINPNLGATGYRFQYGKTTAYEQQTYPSSSIGEDETDHAVSSEVVGLEPDTTYHFRVVATNLGGTVSGPDRTFTTPAAPDILAESAGAIGRTGATLGAVINPNLLSTTYHFEYGTTTVYGLGTAESAPIDSDHVAHQVSAVITGLVPGTTYHYRVVASNEGGSPVGLDQTFTTQPPPVEEPTPKEPVPCKRGFVKKHGKCVKRPKKQHHPKRGHRHG